MGVPRRGRLPGDGVIELLTLYLFGVVFVTAVLLVRNPREPRGAVLFGVLWPILLVTIIVES